jgi:PAS domain S-box-containing protein
LTSDVSEQALILAPTGRDALVAQSMLEETGIRSSVCSDVASLLACLEQGAGFALVTEEALAGADLRALRNWILAQPEWSDFPFVLLTARGGGLERNPSAGRYLETLGNVTFLERPFHPTTLISLAQAALRGRRRQYDARSRLEALQSSEERYRLIVEGAEDFAIVMLDEKGFVTSWNSGAARITGFTPEDAVGRYGDFFFTPEDVENHEPEQELARSRQQGRAVNERWHQRKDGSRFWGSGLSMSLQGGGYLKIFRDATAEHQSQAAIRELNETLEARVAARTLELTQAQEALRQSQKMEAMGQLTGGVAHDFNNLLTPIVGGLDMLQRRGLGNERERRLVEGALQSAERAKTLVQRLLAFARRQPLQPTGIDLHDLIEGMAELVTRASGPRVRVELDIQPNVPPVYTDPNQLEMAILNLAVNARDAMEQGGTLSISAVVDEVGPDHRAGLNPGCYVRLSVTDTGVGMDEATLARAVEPFFSTKGIGKGTGLGLSMVHGLAAQLGGAIAISSRPQAGTTVELWLPIADTAADIPDRVPTASPPPSAGTALLVDDEELVRMSTADMLSDLGYTVIDTDSAEDALRLLTEGLVPSLVVTDHLMPGMTGTELARKVRKRHPEIPVLLVSGFAEVEEIAPDLPRLTKPFRQQELALSVAALGSTDSGTS